MTPHRFQFGQTIYTNQSMMRYYSKKGFTIVELLIVIAVIAILAAITIVAYNGIQARAQYTQHVAQIDEIGKAIRLYRAEGGSMKDGVAGASGSWYGGSASVYAGTSKSMRQALIDSGHLPASALATFMVAMCTSTAGDDRRVVLAKVDPIPKQTVAEQLADSSCTYSGSLATYSDPNQQYKMNIGKVY